MQEIKIQTTKWQATKAIIKILFKLLLQHGTYTSMWHEEIKTRGRKQLHDLRVVWLLFYNRKNFTSFYETASEVRVDLTKHHAMTEKKWGVAMLFLATLLIIFSVGTYGMWKLYIFMDRSVPWLWAAVGAAIVGVVTIGWFLYLFRSLKRGLAEFTKDEILQGRFNMIRLPISLRPDAKTVTTIITVSDTEGDNQPSEDTKQLRMNFASEKFGAGADHKEPWFGNWYIIISLKKPLQNDAGVSFYKHILLSQDIIKCRFFTIA